MEKKKDKGFKGGQRHLLYRLYEKLCRLLRKKKTRISRLKNIMDRKINRKTSHHKRPYDDYVNLPLWEIVKKSIKKLEKNGDLQITTDPYYVIGYLCKSIMKNKNA